MTRGEFVLAARNLLGTPFHHQGRVPGAGLDCAGVVVCAATQCNYVVADIQGYGRIPSRGLFTAAVLDHCDQITLDEVLHGDLMMFAFRGEPQHIAIVSSIDPIMIIHAYQSVGNVAENSLDATWQSRLRGCYRLRGIE